ncbi:MAG: hypothetical protein R3B48_13605 [Kofleriaceae bacterium]
MTQYLWCFATLLLGCTVADADVDERGNLSTFGDGFHRISVSQTRGEDLVWIYAASPPTPGPHPVVVYAHGQGASTLANCWTEGPPSYGDVNVGKKLAEDLASVGYVGVAVFYRNTGDGAPSGDASKFRDHAILDARALLAAARWARDEHGAGSGQVALLGVSMGTFPAFLASTARPELADLQAGLDLRLTVIAGMALNHVANFHRNVAASLASSSANTRAQGILGVAVSLPSIHATALGVDTLTRDNVATGAPLGTRIAMSLRAPARRLFEDLLLRRGGALPFAACAGQTLPAVCSAGCAQAVAIDAFGGLAVPPSLGSWLTDDALDAARYWSPPSQVDPTSAPAGSSLALLRALSPVYHDHLMVTPKVLPLLSARDHVVVAQGQAAADLLAVRLAALGVTAPADVPKIKDDDVGVCEHGDYFLPGRPRCGWAATVAALGRAFSDAAP